MSGYTDITTNLENSRNCLRRIARHDEQQFSKDSLVNIMEKFVKTVNAMDETILVPCRLMDRQVGDSTDITPSKVTPHHHFQHHHNRKVRAITVHEFLSSSDLFNLYNMLNSLKNDLLWTRSDSDEGNGEEEEPANSVVTMSAILPSQTSLADQDRCNEAPTSTEQHKSNSSSNNLSAPIKGHIRRPSTASMASSNSVSNLSDSESEISNENDSGIESEGNCGGSQKGRSSSSASTDKATELARQCRTHLAGLYRCLEQMTEAANYLTARYQSDVGPV